MRQSEGTTSEHGEQGRSLEVRLGYCFRDVGFLDRSLTHASYAHEQGLPPGSDYDRLEFLGDAVLALLLAEHAIREDAAAGSGDLSRRRARLVRRQALAAAGERLGLGAEARISTGERAQGGIARRRLLADLYEGVVGAIYLDGGLAHARDFVQRTLIGLSRGDEPATDDAKSLLQEREQGRGRPAPVYRVIEQTGPPHQPMFLVAVEIGDRVAGQGTGGSKREAEQEAARSALAADGPSEPEVRSPP